MEKSILITGGARSGKSRFAEERTLALGPEAIYIATAQAFDDEMRDRIATHQARRGPEWTTHNAPMELVAMLDKTDGGAPRLVDCLTLWLSNLMLAEMDWEAALDRLCAAIARQSAPVIFVTNEVGAGIVPENALARAYRDAAGTMNQRVAAQCDALYMVVSGHPLRLKPSSL